MYFSNQFCVHRTFLDSVFDKSKFDDTEGVIRSCNLKDRQHNGQKINYSKVITNCDNGNYIYKYIL